MMAVVQNVSIDKCEVNQTKFTVVLKISTFSYLFQLIFQYEPLWMKIDRLSMTLGVENDFEIDCKVKHIVVSTTFANVIIHRRHIQKRVFYNLRLTTVYSEFSPIAPSNGKLV